MFTVRAKGGAPSGQTCPASTTMFSTIRMSNSDFVSDFMGSFAGGGLLGTDSPRSVTRLLGHPYDRLRNRSHVGLGARSSATRSVDIRYGLVVRVEEENEQFAYVVRHELAVTT